jgi:glycosyltransferase involved in cell wall biosynthesis
VYCNNMMVKPLGAWAAQLTGTPCVFHARNLHEQPFKVGFYCHSLARLPAVKCVIANSNATAVPYRRAVSNKVKVVHNGIDLTEYRPDGVVRGQLRRAHAIRADEVVIGYTGNLIERKGLVHLIRAAAHTAVNRRVTFVIVGRVPLGDSGDYLRRCQALIRELGLEERFIFAGFMPEVKPAVVDFDILVLPSLQEPFGRSIIEAMSLGTPVVASCVGGIPEIIRDSVDGLLVPPGDAEALAAALGRLVDDRALRVSLGQAGQARVRDSFDVEKLSAEMQTILLEVATSG